MNIYLTYYSKARNGINISDELFDRELKYNTGRIATKCITVDSTTRLDDLSAKQLHTVSKVRRKLNELCTDMPMTNVCFVNPTEQRFNINVPDPTNYTIFQIPKASGGFRTITAPNENLKKVQKEIAKLLTNTLKTLPHNAAHGFTRNRNCKTALEVHANKKSRWFLKLDIKNFFPSTRWDTLTEARKQVYPLCMFTPGNTIGELLRYCVDEKLTLPQGAPSSPVLTNIVFIPIDYAITEYCKANKLIYTRYADDILISGKTEFNWQQVEAKVQRIFNNVYPDTYRLNNEKTRYGNYNGRNWNLGLMYNNDGKITVGHAKKKLVKNRVHNYLTKPEMHTAKEYNALIGLVGYCKYIEPDYFTPFIEQLNSNKPL